MYTLLTSSLCHPCQLTPLARMLSQPLEAVSPVILNPHLDPKKPLLIELLNKVGTCAPPSLLWRHVHLTGGYKPLFMHCMQARKYAAEVFAGLAVCCS